MITKHTCNVKNLFCDHIHFLPCTPAHRIIASPPPYPATSSVFDMIQNFCQLHESCHHLLPLVAKTLLQLVFIYYFKVFCVTFKHVPRGGTVNKFILYNGTGTTEKSYLMTRLLQVHTYQIWVGGSCFAECRK